MKNLVWLMPIVVSATLILPACKKNQEEPASASQNNPPAPSTSTATTDKMSDADLEKAIRAKLEGDDALKQANLSVSADADHNKATISGTVVSQEMRNKAIDLAKNAQPGITIEDKIDVKPAA
jgi:osmotically-inducible protein OsmY